jgi:hypothetical protein
MNGSKIYFKLGSITVGLYPESSFWFLGLSGQILEGVNLVVLRTMRAIFGLDAGFGFVH